MLPPLDEPADVGVGVGVVTLSFRSSFFDARSGVFSKGVAGAVSALVASGAGAPDAAPLVLEVEAKKSGGAAPDDDVIGLDKAAETEKVWRRGSFVGLARGSGATGSAFEGSGESNDKFI